MYAIRSYYEEFDGMRRWTVFAAALIVLSMVFSFGEVSAKSTQAEKKTTKQTQSAGKSTGKRNNFV